MTPRFSAAMAAVVVLCQQHYSSSFSPPSPLHPTLHISKRRVCSISSRQTFIGVLHASGDDDDDGPLINNYSLLPDDSNDYTTHDPYSRCTHQIAIPLADAAELNIALRDIQTSLVRDCPRLIRACIMPALLRLPLLYVDGRSLQQNNGMNIGGTGGRGSVDVILEQVVHRAIRNVVYGDDTDIDNNNNNNSEIFHETTPLSSDGVMIDLVKPILLPFRGLELQGQDNSVLYAVGNNINEKSEQHKSTNKIIRYNDDNDDDWSIGAPSKSNNNPSGWEVLEKLVYTIQYELENKYGLQTCWPLDEPQGEEIEYEIQSSKTEFKSQQWRPRVPFVRLPVSFYEELCADMKKKGDDNNSPKDDDEGDDDLPIQIDMGFDGISPLFWYETWCDADILPPPGVRMQSIAIYRRMVSDGGEAESSFFIPTSSSSSGFGSSSQPWNNDVNTNALNMQLPIGDAKQMAREQRERTMANEWLGDIEQREERDWEEGKARWMEEMSNRMSDDDDDDDDENSIIDEEFDVGMEFGNISVEGDAAYSTHWSERGVEISSSAVPEESLPDDEDRSKIDSRMIPQSQRLESKSQRKDLPSIDENPIFKRFRSKQSQMITNGQNTALTLDGTPPTTDIPLPPYPSDDHFVGAWRVVSSPLGGEESSFDASSKTSDNFILRVDGQVMGGPILDAQYQHKAAGGNWKMFQATRQKLSVDAYDDGVEDDLLQTQTRLRIRLLVPPEKERVLIMEGKVTRLVMPGSADIRSSSSLESRRLILPAGGIVGMIQSIDDMQLFQSDEVVKKSSGEVLLYCAGEAWMEDFNGGTNRRKLGSFGLQKLKTVKREQLIYTVDVSRQVARGNEIDSEEANSI